MTAPLTNADDARAQAAVAHIQQAVQQRIQWLRYCIAKATEYPRRPDRVKDACLNTTALYPCNKRPVHRLFQLCGVDWATALKVAA